MSIARVLRPVCDRYGLHLVWPFSPQQFDQHVLPQQRMEELLPGARGAALIADGGGDFFTRMAAATMTDAKISDDSEVPHKLDEFTEQIFTRHVGPALQELGASYRFIFPFFGFQPALDFQRLGRAVGLGAPGPLGLQIHPIWGPWWAYRALVVADIEAETEAPIGDGCSGCAAPCVDACHGNAVHRQGLDVKRCFATRHDDPRCADRCDARLACIRGPERRYAPVQIRFHHRSCAV